MSVVVERRKKKKRVRVVVCEYIWSVSRCVWGWIKDRWEYMWRRREEESGESRGEESIMCNDLGVSVWVWMWECVVCKCVGRIEVFDNGL